MTVMSVNHYEADDPPSVVQLKIKPHFDALNKEEQQYAHAISTAGYMGARVVLRQVSAESEHIYDTIIALHKHCNGDWNKVQEESGTSEEDVRQFLNYSAQFLGNLGNYKSFGDSKFVPRIPAETFEKIVSVSGNAAVHYKETKGAIYATKNPEGMHLGYPEKGHVTNYYPESPDIKQEEIVALTDFLKEEHGLLPENTRIKKRDNGDFDVLIASGTDKPSSDDRDTKETSWKLKGKLEGKTARLVYGDHQKEMHQIAVALSMAKKHASNDTEARMHSEYVKSFESGSMKAHKESQRYWIRDKGPMVECNIGFIESYRDPAGVRAEWEGFAAMVNKERTRAFEKLVKSAPRFIPRLPWDKEFEKDHFTSPDFTSLEVLSFCGSGIPAGINIPNYDDIRQTEGFKNVSLGNILGADDPNKNAPSFISEKDREVYKKFVDKSFEVQVGLHELLGHGCGKLLQETEPGKFNFDHKNPPISPITKKPVDTYYKPGQTWGSVFGLMGASYEECRAECVAMALSCDWDILQIFGFGDGKEDINGEAGDVLHTAYLNMARAGVLALEFWDPGSRKWGQAHMQARFAILQAFLSAGESFCKLDKPSPDSSEFFISINRSQILSHGRPAVESFLQKLHIYKSTADVEHGRKLYEDMTNVSDHWRDVVRPEVLRQKKPRRVFVQASTFEQSDGTVELREYPATPVGMIQSWADRQYV